MKRYYFISNDLDDLDDVERNLEEKGIVRPQIHVLSKDDAGVDLHEHLHNIESVLKFDVVHGTILGAIAGFALAVITLAIADYSNWPATYTWTPFIFLAVVLFGFSTWFGGYHGIQNPHKDLKKFDKVIKQGKHVLFVDIDGEQAKILMSVVDNHPRLESAGTGSATPRWVVMAQHRAKDIATHTFP